MRYTKLLLSLVVVLSWPIAGIAGPVSEQGMHDIRQNKYPGHEVIYEDGSIRVLAPGQCDYQDKPFFDVGTENILWIEYQRNKDRTRKTVSIVVYHKNKALDEPLVEITSAFEPPTYSVNGSDGIWKYEIDFKPQTFEPAGAVIDAALATYVPRVAANCNQAELILARQEFHELEALSDRMADPRRKPFNTFLAFEREGDDWILNETYTSREVEQHTIRAVIANPRYAPEYASIRNPEYTYFDGFFLREKGGSEKLKGISYQPSSFWHENFEHFGAVFEKVFVGHFYGAARDEHYRLAFIELIEANSRLCGNRLSGQITEITTEYYTQVTGQMGSYEKDHSTKKVKLKSRYVNTYQATQESDRRSLGSGLSIDMGELMKRANNYRRDQREAESFIGASSCDSAMTNQLLENYYRGLKDLPSLQDDAVKR